MEECMIGSFWSAREAFILHIVNNILSWHRWSIHGNGICAMEELYSRSIDEAMLVGSGSNDSLDA